LPEHKKRLLRIALKEIIATCEGETIRLVLHWQGGDHTQVEFQKMALASIGMSPTMISWRSFARWRGSNQMRGSPHGTRTELDRETDLLAAQQPRDYGLP